MDPSTGSQQAGGAVGVGATPLLTAGWGARDEPYSTTTVAAKNPHALNQHERERWTINCSMFPISATNVSRRNPAAAILGVARDGTSVRGASSLPCLPPSFLPSLPLVACCCSAFRCPLSGPRPPTLRMRPSARPPARPAGRERPSLPERGATRAHAQPHQYNTSPLPIPSAASLLPLFTSAAVTGQ